MTILWVEIPTPEEVEGRRRSKTLKIQVQQARSARELAPLLIRFILDLIEKDRFSSDWDKICDFLLEARPDIKLGDISTVMLQEEITPLFEAKGWELETSYWCNPPGRGLYWRKKQPDKREAEATNDNPKARGILSRLFGCGR
jgi:hypothetical protein